MKIFWLVGLLFFCACTIYIPTNIRVRIIVRRYLDSVNKGDKVDYLKFSDLLTFDGKYMDRQSQLLYKSDPRYKAMSYSDFRKVIKPMEGCEIFCTYRVKGTVHIDLFKIDTAFTKITRVAEISKLPPNQKFE